MIVRTILAVILAAVLVGASLPAIESASRDRTATAVEREVDAVLERATSLVETDDATRGPGARRIVTVHLPAADRTSAEVDSLAFEPSVDDSVRSHETNASAVSWAVAGGTHNRRVVERIDIETRDGDPMVLSDPGRHRLVLSLRGSNAAPRVLFTQYRTRGGHDE